MNLASSRTAIAAGAVAAVLSFGLFSAGPASAATVNSGSHIAAAPANPSGVSTSSTSTATSTKTHQKTTGVKTATVSNDVIDGVSLKVTNTTSHSIAVTFMYEGDAGGQANWTWLTPGQSATASNATASGPDIYNSYLYFPDTNTQVKFESKLAGWTGTTTVTFSGDETEVDRGQTVNKTTAGHSYTVSRGATDISLPWTDWVDGHPTVRPDMGLTLT